MSKASGRPAGSRRVVFRYAGQSGDTVTLHGSFNDWHEAYRQLRPSQEDAGKFTCTCLLRPGRYEYKYQVNGQWLIDEANPNVIANPFGSLNNVLAVPSSAIRQSEK